MNETPLSCKDALCLLLDQVDFTTGACSPTDMVGACIPPEVFKKCREAIAAERQYADTEADGVVFCGKCGGRKNG